MPRDDGSALLDILDACELVVAETNRLSRDGFLNNRTVQDAVLYRLVVLGEAVKRLSVEIRAANPSVRWSAVAGLRDILVHQYDRVDDEEIWRIATTEVPALLEVVRRLPELPRQTGA